MMMVLSILVLHCSEYIFLTLSNSFQYFYSQLFLNGPPTLRWTPGVGPCRFSVILL